MCAAEGFACGHIGKPDDLLLIDDHDGVRDDFEASPERVLGVVYRDELHDGVGQRIVRFANISAREAFGKAHHWAGPKPLADYIGCGLRLDHTPGEMLHADAVDNQIVSLRIGQALSDDFLITISATNYGGNAFYVVMVRPVTPGL